MNKEIRRKLTSRKLWVALVGFVTALLVAFNFAEGDIAKVSAVIMAFATLISYIVGEGLVDAASAKNKEENNKETRW